MSENNGHKAGLRPADWIKTRRELLDDASPGPWEAGETQHYHDGSYHIAYAEVEPSVAAGCDPANAALIADARTSLPCALDALDAVRALHPRDEESPLDSEYGKGFAKGYNRALDDARSRIESVLRGES